ncbi:MAG: hypothetical protein U9Q03_00195 [Patescibacteria group bacterium]|nr:hypothetical protein [Patescibacteria group bacterium]
MIINRVLLCLVVFLVVISLSTWAGFSFGYKRGFERIEELQNIPAQFTCPITGFRDVELDSFKIITPEEERVGLQIEVSLMNNGPDVIKVGSRMSRLILSDGSKTDSTIVRGPAISLPSKQVETISFEFPGYDERQNLEDDIDAVGAEFVLSLIRDGLCSSKEFRLDLK